MQHISPFIRSPFTDLSGGLISHQVMGQTCGPMELQMMECVEVYGIDLGAKKCRCLIDDFYECQSKAKQFARFVLMRKERDKQIAEGKLKDCRKYLSPKVDSY